MTIRKWFYRRKVRRLYLRYLKMRDDYDCGDALFEELCPAGALLWKQVEDGVARLKAWEVGNG